MYKELLDKINDCDMLLIGIGSDVSIDFGFNVNEEKAFLKWKAAYKMAHSSDADNILDFYNRLSHIIEGKNYFVITTNVDGIINRSKLNPIRVVAPCGSIDRLQCKCLDEEGISDVPANYYENSTAGICEVCNSMCTPNIFNREYYNESAYIKQWNLYNKWLQGTLNKNLLVIEFGCDFSMASIIRLPFEKIVMINEKSSYYRINNTFPQITAELKDRMTSISRSPFEVVKELSL